MKKKTDLKGLKISNFNTANVLISCLLYICLLTVTFSASNNYEHLVSTVDDHIQLEDAARDILNASDYLTEQVRLYTQTLDPVYVRRYFEEAHVTRRRENALELMQKHSRDHSSSHYQDNNLELAVQLSNELMIMEIYSMKLVSTAMNHTGREIPAEVSSVVLEDADLRLSQKEQLEKARSLLYDKYYQDMKKDIHGHLDIFTRSILNTTETQLTDSLDTLSASIRTQRLLLLVLIFLNMVAFFIITRLVINPLKVFIKCVQNRSLFQVTGSYEFKYLAQVYNEIYTRSDSLAASEALLRTKAERDGLTSILNRYMFQQVCDLLKDSKTPLALILLDVDKFKEVNDTYGHVMGDKVLIRVAEQLTECFRGSDYVFRIGGDEFAAILPTATPENGERILAKLSALNHHLNNPEPEQIPVSLSIGVAFSTYGYHGKLFEQADRAMYVVKQNGRNGCRIYTDDMADDALLES